GGDGRAVRQLRPGDADRRAVHLHRAGAAVQGLPAPRDHPGSPAAVAGRRLRRPARGGQEFLDALADRPDHADGDSHQELDPAGGVRHRRPQRARHEPPRCPDRRLPQARPADHHDHHRHGRGHAADRHRFRHGRPELPFADVHRRDRGPDHVHGAQPAGDPGRLHLCRRRRAPDRESGPVGPRAARACSQRVGAARRRSAL
ncbi:MAG: Cobalt-zinc-cadmium resistance protein CzcA; Cation efflux system protein CusA, partial [uncultured Ramlibacter sp.]